MLIKNKIKCGNQVIVENGSVLCGIYQEVNGIKQTWLCEECINLTNKEKK